MKELEELEVEQKRIDERREKLIDMMFENFLKRCEGKTVQESREVLVRDFSKSEPFEFGGELYREMKVRFTIFIEKQLVIGKIVDTETVKPYLDLLNNGNFSSDDHPVNLTYKKED